MWRKLGLVAIVALNCQWAQSALRTDLNSTNYHMPDWSEGAQIPEVGRANIYQWEHQKFFNYQRQGRVHTLDYPVESTGVLLPYHSIKRFVDRDTGNLLDKFMSRFFKMEIQIDDFEDLQAWLGLHKYPEETGQGPYWVPKPADFEMGDRMGMSRQNRFGTVGFTYSCAACHSGNLFGQKVIGMTNRTPRAFDLFAMGKEGMKLMGPTRFRVVTGASREEGKLFGEAKKNVAAVGTHSPQFFGLDASFAHTALSLSRRNQDEFATKNKSLERKPRKHRLDNFVADSKPAVWWNLKYKNKFLLDGSQVSGNPILMALLVNEIGRGTDLRKFDQWVDNNQKTIDEITTALFATQAPHITDFFSAERFDLEQLRRGQKIFSNRCSRCHGDYEKAWDTKGFEKLPLAAQLKTVRVLYHKDTPVKNVGTDPNRAEATLLELNSLHFAKKHGIKFKVQDGYIPPPLEGIWARWPYLHNNSVPSLCQLLLPQEERVNHYYMGEANDPQKDFDFDCNGYPLGEATPEEWRRPEQEFRAGGPGLSNQGHDKGRSLTAQDRQDLIRFLQTL